MSILETRILNMAQIDSVLAEYLAECDELIQQVAASLRLVERAEYTADTIDSIYRDIHTVKGSAQLFGFMIIGDIGHAMETSLDPVRREKRAPDASHLEMLHRGLDAIEKAAAAIRRGEDPVADSSLKTLIDSLAHTHSHLPHSAELKLSRESAPIAALESTLSKTTEIPTPVKSAAPAPLTAPNPVASPAPEAKADAKADAETNSSIRV
ncbi:MAG: hypothetical protein EOP11_19560, partial [Proteobacteria bacterium]